MQGYRRLDLGSLPENEDIPCGHFKVVHSDYFSLFPCFHEIGVTLGMLPIPIHLSFYHLLLLTFVYARYFGFLLSIVNATIWESLPVYSPSLSSSPEQAVIEKERKEQ